MKTISLFVDNGSYLTRMHPFTKLLYILTAVAVSLIWGQLFVYGIFIFISVLILVSGKLIKKAIPLIAFSFTILITIFIIHGLFHQGNENVLFSIGALHFYQEGLVYALFIGCNILNMLLSFAVFVLTTRTGDLVEVLEKAGFPSKFTYVISSVFQIVPQMTASMHTIMDAQRSRGLETEGSLLVRAKAFLPLISPVVMSSLINTRERAIALEIRGFESGCRKTYLRERKKSRADLPVVMILILVLVLSVAGRVKLCLLSM